MKTKEYIIAVYDDTTMIRVKQQKVTARSECSALSYMRSLLYLFYQDSIIRKFAERYNISEETATMIVTENSGALVHLPYILKVLKVNE